MGAVWVPVPWEPGSRPGCLHAPSGLFSAHLETRRWLSLSYPTRLREASRSGPQTSDPAGSGLLGSQARTRVQGQGDLGARGDPTALRALSALPGRTAACFPQAGGVSVLAAQALLLLCGDSGGQDWPVPWALVSALLALEPPALPPILQFSLKLDANSGSSCCLGMQICHLHRWSTWV